jgi:hypothetical protein
MPVLASRQQPAIGAMDTLETTRSREALGEHEAKLSQWPPAPGFGA